MCLKFFPAVEQFLLFNFCNFTIPPHVRCGYFLLGRAAPLSSVRLRFQFARSLADHRSPAEGRAASIITFSELLDIAVTNFHFHFALNSKLMKIL